MTNINLEEITFEWAHGKDKHDNMPVRMSGTWNEFAKFLRTPLPKVKGKDHFAGPFGNDGRRCNENSLVRQYLPFDLDGTIDGDGCLDNATFDAVIEYFDQYEGVYYETSSSKPGDRCARFILPVSRPINSEESNAVGHAITQALGIDNLKWDKSVYKLSQPVYLPVADRTLIPLGIIGDPKVLNVDETLKNVDVLPAQISSKLLNRIAMSDDPVVKKLQEANLIFKQDSKSLAYDIACPFEDDHSENQYVKDSSTQYFAANTGGFAKGNFKCLHNSCSGHTQQDFLTKLGIAAQVEGTPLIKIKPFQHVDPKEIPPRKIISIGGMKCFAKGFLSLTGAAGGTGKSSLAIVEELSLVYGLDLLATTPNAECAYPPLKCGRQRVWSMSLEDDEEEHQRRVVAALQHYGLDPALLRDWYFVTYKSDSPVNVATLGRDGYVVTPQVEQIEKAVRDNQIDVLMVDPFVNTHGIPENDNGNMNKVADIWRSIAQQLKIVTNLTHHIRKQSGMTDVSSDDLRGAGSLSSAARLVRVLAPMSKEEAMKLGVAEDRRRFHFWVNPSAKANIVPPASSRHWFHLASVDLGNTQDFWESDSIGVVEYWQPTVDASLVTDDSLVAVYKEMGDQSDEILSNRCRVSHKAKEKQYGYLVGAALNLDFDDLADKKRITNLIDAWLVKGVLKKKDVKGSNRNLSPCYWMEKPSISDDDSNLY